MTTILTTKQVKHGATALDTVLDAKIQVAVDYSTSFDPPAISANSSYTQVLTVSGALVGDFTHLSFSQDSSGCIMCAQVLAANQVTVHIFNLTASTVNLPSGTLKIRLTRSA